MTGTISATKNLYLKTKFFHLLRKITNHVTPTQAPHVAEEEETTAEDAIMATVVVEDKTMLLGLPEKKLKRIPQHLVESQEKAVID